MFRKALSYGALTGALGMAYVIAAPHIAFAQQQFNVGDRVTVGSTGETGTVIAVGQQMLNGGVQLKVHLDRMGTDFPDVGVPYDSVASRVTPLGGGGAPGQPQQADPTQQQQQAMPQAPQQLAPQQMPAPQMPPQQMAPQQPVQQGGGGQFNVGDRVTIGSTGETGTIVWVGQQMSNGGWQLKVHLDRLQGPPDVGMPVDSVTSRVTPGG